MGFNSVLKGLKEMVKVKVMVKCNLVQALRLCTGSKAHRGSRGIALLLGEGKMQPCTGTEALYRP
jgi:hypothetical protein